MDYTVYNEELLVSSGFNLQLSPNTYLIDLLRLEYCQELRYEFALAYLQEISKGSQFKIFSSLQDLSPNSIVLLPDWTAYISANSLYVLSTQQNSVDKSRANLNSALGDQLTSLNTIEIFPQRGFTYIVLYFCKTFVKALNDIEELSKSCDFEASKNCIRNELAGFIYATARLSAKIVLFRVNEAKESLEAGCDLKQQKDEEVLIIEKTIIKASYKPLSELLVNTLQRGSVESLEYTQSEDTNKAETSFRLSNTITGRFPRLSGSSLALMETPSKDTKKSYAEYTEFMESPRFSSINPSPCKILSTPKTSPKQSLYSIQEVKSFLIPPSLRVQESPYEKVAAKKAKSNNLRTFSFQDSVKTDCVDTKDAIKAKTVFEEKKASCQCQNCEIF